MNDFASAVGTGAALYVKFAVRLAKDELERYRKWLAIAREHDLARAPTVRRGKECEFSVEMDGPTVSSIRERAPKVVS